MERKLPPEAFEYYLSLGVKRSYQAVAEQFGASKVAVVNLAKREGWQRRVQELEAKARTTGEQKALQSREELSDHYIKTWTAVERRALEALRNYPISSAIDAVRALNMATRNMLLLRGEPTDRVENLEQLVRREYERWMPPVGEDDGDGGVVVGTEVDGQPSAEEREGDDAAAL